MNASSKVPQSPAEHADNILEEAIDALKRYAQYSTKHAFMDGGYQRGEKAFALGLQLNALRRDNVLARLDDEKLKKARAA